MNLEDLISKVKFENEENGYLEQDTVDAVASLATYDEKVTLLNEVPYVFPYVASKWKNSDNIERLAKIAVAMAPDVVTKLGKGGIVAIPELVSVALDSDPLVIFKFNDDLKQLVSKEAFISAFSRNILVMLADVPVLKSAIRYEVKTVKDGKEEIVKVKSNVRSECLKAIRLAEGVSRYHEGYDNFANVIALKLRASKTFKKNATSDAFTMKVPTAVNAMIKKENPKLRAMPVESWRLNRNKTLYSAVRKSVKADSKLKDLLADIPTTLLPAKVTKKAVACAIMGDPEVYNKLSEYGLEDLKADAYIQFVTFKSCKKHDRMDIIEGNFDSEQTKLANKKFKMVKTRKENIIKKKKEKLNEQKTQNVEAEEQTK